MHNKTSNIKQLIWSYIWIHYRIAFTAFTSGFTVCYVISFHNYWNLHKIQSIIVNIRVSEMSTKWWFKNNSKVLMDRSCGSGGKSLGLYPPPPRPFWLVIFNKNGHFVPWSVTHTPLPLEGCIMYPLRKQPTFESLISRSALWPHVHIIMGKLTYICLSSEYLL